MGTYRGYRIVNPVGFDALSDFLGLCMGKERLSRLMHEQVREIIQFAD
jgi:hypothetical protein